MTKLGEMLREDGIKEGIEKTSLEIARKLLKNRALTKEEIAKTVDLSIQKIEEIEKELLSIK